MKAEDDMGQLHGCAARTLFGRRRFGIRLVVVDVRNNAARMLARAALQLRRHRQLLNAAPDTVQ